MGYLISMLTNKKLILDSFEPHAMAMLEGNIWTKRSIAFKLLFFLEKKQLKRASEVICTVEKMIEYSQETYGIKKKRYFSKPACVNLDTFSYKNIKNTNLLADLNLNNSIVCVYAGKFGGLYLENETFDFFKIASEYFGETFKVLLLTSHSDEEISNYIVRANLKKEVIIKQFVSHSDIPNYIGLADFAICPMRSLPSRRYSTPIKNGEYWALGLPVVITKNISDDSDIIKDNKIGSVLEELNNEMYLRAVKEIDELLKNNTHIELYNKIRPIAEKYRNFTIANAVYKEIYGNN
jgi:glycosyltransferase involved in cell wall biosynthesis